MVWPCFVDALCDLQYYFSTDEVLLICMAARVSDIVFTAQGDEFAYAGDSGADSDGNAVVPIVLDYAAETLKGHFSRLLQNGVSWFINSLVQESIEPRDGRRLFAVFFCVFGRFLLYFPSVFPCLPSPPKKTKTHIKKHNYKR